MGNDKTNKISEFQDRVLNLVRFGDLLELGLGLRELLHIGMGRGSSNKWYGKRYDSVREQHEA